MNSEPLPLNQAAIDVLEANGNVRHISGYVFPSDSSTKFDASNLRRSFNLAIEKAGIEHVRFHDLRHTFATRLVQSGINLYVVKELLGHKSLKMTMRHAHHYPESLRHRVDILNRLRENAATICYSSKKRGYDIAVTP